MEAAGQLVRAKDGSLKVLVIAPDASSAQGLENAVRTHLEKRGEEAEIRVMIKPTLPRLIFAVQGMGPVVVPVNKEFLCDEPLCEFISMIRNPVLLVR